MRDRPIKNHNDAHYTIKYKKEAKDTFKNYFENSREVVFLNGQWGSGKTSFLNIVFENNNKFKIKFIDLWRVTNNQKTSELIYKRIFPISYWLIKYFFLIVFVILSGIALHFSRTDDPQLAYPLFLSGFLSGLNQIIGKMDYDNIFLICLKYRSYKKFFIKRKIIVIDDFDRISNDKQLDLYKIFNLLNNPKIQFVFLGDYTNIVNTETRYLQKIIERRIELPYAVSPSNIWSQYFEQLIIEINDKRSIKVKKIEEENIIRLKNILIGENRVLREKKIFERYINEILFLNSRYDQVNLDQQLVIIYLYLFHVERYNGLVSNIENLLRLKLSFSSYLLDKNSNDRSSSIESTKSEFNTLIGFANDNEISQDVTKLVWDILLGYSISTEIESHSRNKYVFDGFDKQFPNYLINYIPQNMTGNEIKKLLNEDISLNNYINKIREDKNNEIYNFILRNQNNFSNGEFNKLLDLSIGLIKGGYDDDEHGLNDKANRIHKIVSLSISHFYNDLGSKAEEKVNKFEQNFSECLDLSQKLRVYLIYLGVPMHEYMNRFLEESKIALSTNEFSKMMYPEYVVCLVYNRLEEIEPTTLDKILKFKDKTFYSFMLLFFGYRIGEKYGVKVEDAEAKKLFEARLSTLEEPYKSKIYIT